MKYWLCIVLMALICCFPFRSEAKIYRWVDNKGVEHFTNDEQKIPANYRNQVVVSDLSGKSKLDDEGVKRTVIHFQRKGNSVLVNGMLNDKVPVVFQVDTGATETLITPEDAANLGLDTKSAPLVRTRVADGREVQFPRVQLKSVRIGNAEVRDLSVLVGQTRLLGLSFLNEFKMTMDGEHGQLVLEMPTHQRELESPEVTEEKNHLIAEYEAKQEKLRLSVSKVEKNIAILESEINSLQNRQDELELKIEQAYQQDALILNVSELEATLQRLQLSRESRELQIENYQKDIEIYENNIEYYENRIQKFQ